MCEKPASQHYATPKKGRGLWEGFDLDAFLEALYAGAGVLAGSGIDAEAWIEEIREARKQDGPSAWEEYEIEVARKAWFERLGVLPHPDVEP